MIQSLQIGFQIVDLIAEQDHPLKFTDIQELSGITKSNLYKYLNTLTYLGLVYRDKKQGTYSLGSKLIEYGMLAIGSQDVIGTVTPYLRDISRHTSLSALVAVWTQDSPVIANISSSNATLNIGAQIGNRLPLHSATGRIFSAFQHEHEMKEWKQTALEKLPEAERTAFEEEEAKIQREHFAYTAEPLVKHVSSFSVPLLKYDSELVGALTVVGFSTDVPKTPHHETSRYVLQCAEEISESFGYRKQ